MKHEMYVTLHPDDISIVDGKYWYVNIQKKNSSWRTDKMIENILLTKLFDRRTCHEHTGQTR